MGKTAAAFQWAEHVARVEGVPTVYVTFENSPQNLVERLLASKAGGSLESIARGTIGEANLKQAANDLTQTLHRVAIIEGTSRLTVAGLKGKVRQAMNTCATTRALVVVDYLQLWAKASKELAGRRDVRERVEVLGAELREMATALGVPVLALSSLNRDAGGYGKGNSKATLDALKESGDLEYMADVVLLLNQGEAMVTTPDKSVELTIAKNRNGATGTVSLIFHPNKMTFTEGKKVTEW
jgi:replicative DNA helicase